MFTHTNDKKCNHFQHTVPGRNRKGGGGGGGGKAGTSFRISTVSEEFKQLIVIKRKCLMFCNHPISFINLHHAYSEASEIGKITLKFCKTVPLSFP